MNIENLNSGYVRDAEEYAAKLLIKEYEKKIEEQKQVLKKKMIIKDIFVDLLNAKPYKENGEWFVSGEVRRDKQKDLFGEYRLSSEDRLALDFASGYLTSCGIPNSISLNENEFVSLNFRTTLQERDSLEEYMMKNEEKETLTKVMHR